MDGNADDRPMTSTPAVGRRTDLLVDFEVESSRFMERIDFDDVPKKDRRSLLIPERDSTAWETKVLDNVSRLVSERKMTMKPAKFDGTGSLESFLAQFDVCARHNRWTAIDKVDFLRVSLEKAATQLLWDFGARTEVTYEQLVERLRQRYGAEGQAETFRAQLYYRRQRADESLGDLLHDIRRLVVLAYPVPSNETTEIVAKDAFLEAIRDRELSLKVREREPKTIDEAYRTALRLSAYQQTADLEDRRRPANRIRGTQEADTRGQLQSQLDDFFTAQRKWQQDMEERICRQLEGLRSSNRTNFNSAPMAPPTIPSQGNASGSLGRGSTCFKCGSPGHYARQCRQRRQFPDRRNDDARDSGQPTTEQETVTNHTTRDRATGVTNNAIYIHGVINGRQRTFLVDTGSEVSLVPSSDVDGLLLQPSTRILLAANGTQIRVLGQVDVPIRISRGFSIETNFLVSDQIGEPMLGMDWLRQHRCRLGFGQGALFVGRRRISLVKGNGSLWCRRVIVAEETTVLPRSQCDIPCRTQYRDLTTTAEAWMTESKEIRPGLHVARVVLNDDDDKMCIRVVNLNEQPAMLTTDLMLGDLHPVNVEVMEGSDRQTGPEAQLVEKLMEDVSEDVSAEVKERLKNLLVEYGSIFSTTDHDLGRTMITQHRIDTGDSHPVRQPLRRQPLPYQATIDAQLEQMLVTGVVEPDGNGQTYSTYAAELLEKFEKAYRAARQGLRKGAERRKHSYDLRVRPAKFEAGDWVYYFSPRKFVGRSPKFQRNFTGPWMIVRACGPVNYLLQKSPKAKPFVAHVDKLRHCYGRTKGEWTEATEKVTGGSPQKVTGSATASTSRRPHRRGDGTRETDAHDQDLDGVATSTGRPRRNAGRPVRFQ